MVLIISEIGIRHKDMIGNLSWNHITSKRLDSLRVTRDRNCGQFKFCMQKIGGRLKLVMITVGFMVDKCIVSGIYIPTSAWGNQNNSRNCWATKLHFFCCTPWNWQIKTLQLRMCQLHSCAVWWWFPMPQPVLSRHIQAMEPFLDPGSTNFLIIALSCFINHFHTAFF